LAASPRLPDSGRETIVAINLAVIVIICLFLDSVLKRLRLPGLLGMLAVGIVAGPYVLDLLGPELISVSADFRRIALIVILLRAGMKTNAATLLRVGRRSLLLSFLPALAEGTAVFLVAHPLLGLPPLEAAILASVVAAVSPAVVVPSMISFMDRRLGTAKGIPSMLLAGSAGDNVFAIVIFGVMMGLYTGSSGSVAAQLARIPVSIALGILLGLLAGYVWYRIFERHRLAGKKVLLLIGTAIVMTWMEERLASFLPLASLLGVMTLGFIILEKSEEVAHRISDALGRVWVFAEILLFVLVGAQVNIHVAWQAGLAGSAVIAVGLAFRSAGTWLSVLGSGLNPKERLFTVVSYLPKATVQAAIGAVPLTMGVPGGEVILAVAVLSILLTAPLGAVAIQYAGERCLEEER
jgi:NhaP-type Na+/H+ or K+/H+ antiporter